MKRLFADTRAADVSEASLITPERCWQNSAHGDHTRRLACRLVREILSDPGTAVVTQSHDSFLAGLALYERRPDKQYSLVDCISMNVMRHGNIKEVLTNDRHFSQEGFVRLLDLNA